MINLAPRVPCHWCRVSRLPVFLLLSAVVACGPRDQRGSSPAEAPGEFDTTADAVDPPSADAASVDPEPRAAAIPTPDETPKTLEPPPAPRIIELEGGVRTWVDAGRVEFPGEITLE
ncbi:MAG: hypothetical protein GY728_10560, partial [Phycisphaeraceae bacterium]|nr:hypothetical protein [Phycisphaeraceae bacterium]